jgi:hypothetical protein
VSKRELIAKQRDAILALAAKHGATDLRLFGSVARGEDTPESDVDILARFPNATGWQALAGPLEFEEELSILLGCKAHVLREHGHMRARVRESIAQDLVML